jgi:RNA ligase/Putative tRNA binding domain
VNVMVMEVLEVSPHASADALRVYQLGKGDGSRLQVVANLSTVYEVGDRVAIAMVGCELKDGTRIRPARLRGIDSYGMAVGKHDAPVGTDVSDEFCAATPGLDADAQLIAWPSIELLHHVRSGVRATCEVQGRAAPRIRYRAKIKLDGTNAGVQILPDGRVIAQSRSQVLGGGSDNSGFAAWVAENAPYFASSRQAEPLVLFGEWCGQGIQKRAAISQIGRKVFAVFAAQLGRGVTSPAAVELEPELLRARLPAHPDVFVLPWLDATFELDFADDVQAAAEAERISAEVERVEAEDPWVAETFGVRGLGEGIVLYPQLGEARVDRQQLSELMFKAKGEKHQAVRQKRAAQLEPELARGVDSFVELVLAPARLEQGLTEACAGKAETANIPAFLKWVASDVQKECGRELEAAALTWEQVNRAISNRARSWLLQRIRSS